MLKDDKPTIVCLTPVKNEAWILDLFLRCASLWADHIIIADQGSDDGSREIAARYGKVTVIDNASRTFNEAERQTLLIEAGRKIPGKRLFIALDADEVFTPEVLTSREWDDVLAAPLGTVVRFNWANLHKGFDRFWNSSYPIPFGFMDDGTPHSPLEIHSPRVPSPAGAPVIDLKQIRVMHYQYAHWERMRSKHRWYQCWERLHNSQRAPAAVFRQYHHMHGIGEDELHAVPRGWIDGYRDVGIDMTALVFDKNFYWDRLVLGYFEQYGASHFSRAAIWDLDWEGKARALGMERPERFRDPRTLRDKLMHLWLWQTQRSYHRRPALLMERLLTGTFNWHSYA